MARPPSTEAVSGFGPTPSSILHRVFFNLFNHTSRAICADLREVAHDLRRIIPHGNDGISASSNALTNHPLHRRVPGRVKQVREIFELAANDRFQNCCDVCTPISRSNSEPIHCIEDADDTISQDLIHRRSDDAVGVSTKQCGLLKDFPTLLCLASLDAILPLWIKVRTYERCFDSRYNL